MTEDLKKTKVIKIKDSFLAIGRRKTAIAKVKLVVGTGKFTINNQEISNPSRVYTEPLKITNYDKRVDIFVKVSGGGLVAQEGAIRLGISRALEKLDPDLHKTLKVEGFLTRDSRMKERKKPGLKGARRSPQWQKR